MIRQAIAKQTVVSPIDIPILVREKKSERKTVIILFCALGCAIIGKLVYDEWKKKNRTDK
jgi:hypothetical protein